MSIVALPAFAYPKLPETLFGSNPPSAFSNVTLNASGHKAAAIFRAPKAGNIHKIGFRLGTLTTPTDTDFRVETVSAQFPTGTLWGTNTNATIVSASLAANAMNMATLTADATVAANDLVAIVLAPSGSPNINTTRMNSIPGHQLPYWAQFTASWAANTSAFVAAVEYSDGTYAVIPAVFPISASNTHTFNSGSTPDEIGARFRLPISMRIRGAQLAVDLDNSTEIVLYDSDGVTPLATSSTLTNDGRASTAGHSPYSLYFSSAVTLQANTYYYLSVKPGASNVSIYSWDMLSAAALDQIQGGQDWHYVSAKDPSGTGSWTPITTRYPLMGLLIDGIDNGAAAKPNIFDNGIIRAVTHDSY